MSRVVVRTRLGDGLMTAGALVLLIDTFLPWYRIGGGEAAVQLLRAAGRPIPLHGTAWQSFTGMKLLLVALILIALGASLLRAIRRNHVLSVPPSAPVFVLGALTSVLVLDKIARPPGGTELTDPAAGAYIGLAAAAVITLGAALGTGPLLDRASPPARWWEPSAQVFAALLAGITGLAFLLRVPTLGSQSLWGDELFTLWHVRGSLGDLASQLTDTEGMPYLYFLFAKGWVTVFGTGEAALRSLSTLVGVAVVPVSALVARELFSRRVALLTALLVATNPLLVWYSQEARPYALLVFFCALGLLFFVHAVRALRARAIALWVVFSTLALLTHYFAVFSVLPQVVWLLVLARSRACAWRVAVLAAAPLAVILVLAPLVNHQRKLSGLAGIEDVPLDVRAASLARGFLFGPTQPCLPPYDRPCQLGISVLALAVLCVILILLAALLTRLPRDWPGFRLVGILFISAVLVPAALAVVGVDFLTLRNTIPGVVPFALLVAGCAFATRPGVLPAVLVAVLGVTSVGAVWARTELQRPRYDGPVAAAGPPGADRLVVISPGMQSGPFGVLWPNSRPFAVADRARVNELVVAGIGPFSAPAHPDVPSLDVPPGFRLSKRVERTEYVMLRYRSTAPRSVGWPEVAALKVPPDRSAAVYLQQTPSGPGESSRSKRRAE